MLGAFRKAIIYENEASPLGPMRGQKLIFVQTLNCQNFELDQAFWAVHLDATTFV